MKAQEIKKLLSLAARQGRSVLLQGLPGVGKSELVAVAARDAGYSLLIEHPVCSEPADYKGLPVYDNGQALFVLFSRLKPLFSPTIEPTILFFDDLIQAPQSVQAALMQIVLAREVAGHKLAPQVLVWGATNRREDRAGGNSIIAPLLSRFDIRVTLDADADSWSLWAMSAGVRPDIAAYIRWRGDEALAEAVHPVNPTPSPRSWVKLSNIINDLEGCGLESLIPEVVISAVGQVRGGEYLQYRELARKMPDVRDMMKNPGNCAIPGDPGIRIAITTRLISLVDTGNISAAFQIAERMGGEFAAMLACGVSELHPALCSTPTFTTWAINNNILNV